MLRELQHGVLQKWHAQTTAKVQAYGSRCGLPVSAQ